MKSILSSILESTIFAAVLALAADPVLAQSDLANSVTTVHTGISSIPNVVSGLFYIGGAAMMGAGALQLKNHAENPNQYPLGKGLGRVTAGGALVALPAFGQWLNNSMAIGSQAVTSQGFGIVQ